MKRISLFEFEDQKWFPSLLRGFITDLLQHQLVIFDVYVPIIDKLHDAMQKTHCSTIIDLCSGSSGPLLNIQKILTEEKDYPISITLTDKYPNISAFKELQGLSKYPLNFIDTSVDITCVPIELKGFRTLFTAFHHLPPEIAENVLRDAVENNTPIGIFEFTERTPANIIKALLFSLLLVWIETPFISPFKWSRFFWTYLIPVLPFVYLWDALVSHLRSYSLEELNDLIDKIQCKTFNWETGKIKSARSGFNVTYLIGYPILEDIESDNLEYDIIKP